MTTETCPKGTRKNPCAGTVAIVRCEEDGHGDEPCGAEYGRCEAHGGVAGARRSLTSHKGMFHYTPTKDPR